MTLKLKGTPTEAVHFLEYGLLGFFIFRALNHSIKDKSIYVSATLLALLIGTFDEIIQWITPHRYWGFRDVGLNGLSGGLFQLAIWKVVAPKAISEKINMQSFRIFTYIIASCLILLGLCASNTPQRVAYYTKKIPWLSFLQKEESMSEFGFKYEDREIGVFYSRLSPMNLKRTDSLRGEQCAKILGESVNKNYEQFLREYSPTIDPFMHELRVHIFRRDAHFNRGIHASDLDEKKEYYFVAYKENLILEKYFSQSIKRSVYKWSEDNLRRAVELIDKNKSYESPVSAELFNLISEKIIWLAIFALISILVVVNLLLRLLKKNINNESL